jgi:antitoxin ChpS
METAIRKLGNSAGIILPAALLRSMKFEVGQVIDIEVEDGRIVVTPKRSKRYTAAELNAQCDSRAPMPEDMVAWENAPVLGSETL